MASLTDEQRAFIRDNPYYAVVTTMREDGSPHENPPEAQDWERQALVKAPDDCHACGLCVEACPEDAITLRARR